MRRILLFALVLALCAAVQPAQAAQGPVGNWNIKVKVGHVGEGIRTVILRIKKMEDGKYDIKMS